MPAIQLAYQRPYELHRQGNAKMNADKRSLLARAIFAPDNSGHSIGPSATASTSVAPHPSNQKRKAVNYSINVTFTKIAPDLQIYPCNYVPWFEFKFYDDYDFVNEKLDKTIDKVEKLIKRKIK